MGSELRLVRSPFASLRSRRAEHLIEHLHQVSATLWCSVRPRMSFLIVLAASCLAQNLAIGTSKCCSENSPTTTNTTQRLRQSRPRLTGIDNVGSSLKSWIHSENAPYLNGSFATHSFALPRYLKVEVADDRLLAKGLLTETQALRLNQRGCRSKRSDSDPVQVPACLPSARQIASSLCDGVGPLPRLVMVAEAQISWPPPPYEVGKYHNQ